MRVAAVAFVFLLAAVARADDDDRLLDSPPLGEPIPERMETLERDWANEVGTPQEREEPADEREHDEVDEPIAPADNADEPRAPATPPAAEEPSPSRSPSRRPLSADGSRRPSKDSPSAKDGAPALGAETPPDRPKPTEEAE
jgi:hypothetical protein